MAVEIKELIIRAVAVDELDTSNNVSQNTGQITPELQAQIVQNCVKEVLKIIERKSSR